jgi:hypothetical protein
MTDTFRMNRRQLRHLDPEDADDILRDGETMRVPVSLMDSMPRTKIGDGLAMHRNGWRLPASSLRDSKQRQLLDLLYAQRDAETENAWREDYPGASEGDPCTCRGADFPNDIGSPGHIELHEGRLCCVPDNPSANDARSVRDARVRAYLDYDRDLTTAWAKPINKQRADGYPGRYNKSGQLVADPPTGQHDARSLADKVKDHRANMEREYEAYNQRLSSAYKR